MTAHRSFYLNASEMSGWVRNAIAMRAPTVAMVADVDNILGGIVDIVIYGGPLHPRLSPLEYMTDLGVPTDVAKDTITYLLDVTQNALRVCIGMIDPTKSYQWHFDEVSHDLVITEHIPIVKTLSMAERENEFKAAVLAAMDNGDYIPESIRRIAGVY